MPERDLVQEAFVAMMTADSEDVPAAAREYVVAQGREREARIRAAREEWLEAMDACRCIWEVLAGVIPGEPEPTLTRRWAMTSAEWEAPDRDGIFFARR